MLRAAKAAAEAKKPVIGINAGRLAYLCELDGGETELLKKIPAGKYYTEKRMMLRADIYENDRLITSFRGLNDIVFSRGEKLKLINLSVATNGKKSMDYIADGLIFATPTGSTGYSLSAGGPILEPTLEAVAVTPVSPHSALCRPFIFTSDTLFEVTAKQHDNLNSVYCCCDGETPVKIEENMKIIISRAKCSAEFICIKQDGFIDRFNNKM